MDPASPVIPAYWAEPEEDLLRRLASAPDGLSEAAAAQRRAASAKPPETALDRAGKALLLLLRQFTSPLVLILLFAAALSLLLRNWIDAAIMLAVLLATGLLGFVQEFRASRAVEALASRLALRSRVMRDGVPVTIDAAAVVPGDVLALSAGDLIPADGRVLTATDFLVTEAALTGESLPVEKSPGVAEAAASIAARRNCVFAGTSVRSGMARVLVVATGAATEVSGITGAIAAAEPETGFERGVRGFGHMLIRVMFVLVSAVVAVNSMLGRPTVDSLLFAVALAVGITPELLPAIVSVTLSAGARQLSQRGVLVRRLAAIENLGSMDVLCTDKTGTLTEGTLSLSRAVSPDGEDAADVLALAHLNAAFETGIENPMDQAILAAAGAAGLSTAGWLKRDEIPYDFVRKRLTVVVERDGERLLVTKGAVSSVLSCCSRVAAAGGDQEMTPALHEALSSFVARQGLEGFRCLALATRSLPERADYGLSDEQDLTLRGFLLFADPLKAGIGQVIARLQGLGVGIKIITGDSREVAVHTAGAIGLDTGSLLTGRQISAMSAEALRASAEAASVFCEIDPQQKERIIEALQKRGHVVGYMGDGINDAPALHAADVGISVDSAVDVARQSADFVLLKRDLDILGDGILCGRRAFANTRKYIAITTSANFGNMVSMAVAAPLLPFFPMLPKQVLLNNFLSDIPAIALSTDAVEDKALTRSGTWDIAELRRFMVIFGLVSSAFDIAGFLFLLWLAGENEGIFQTGWFALSVLTEVLVIFSLRTRGPALLGRPSLLLLASAMLICAAALALPGIAPARAAFDFVPLPAWGLAALTALAFLYVATTEFTKRAFYRRLDERPHRRKKR